MDDVSRVLVRVASPGAESPELYSRLYPHDWRNIAITLTTSKSVGGCAKPVVVGEMIEEGFQHMLQHLQREPLRW